MICIALGSSAKAQSPVANDDIDNRLPLTLGEPLTSRTDGCTVQWRCVDEALTGKQIDYHNDQWFSFRPPRAGRYYVNINGQQCRETRGVQLIALTAGQLCVPSTYTILSSVSLGTQDNVFVPFTAAVAGEEILLCVDGYLHDYCRFSISVDTVARGLPAGIPPKPSTEQIGNAVVELTWALPDSLSAATGFVVYRRAGTEARATAVADLPVRRTTAGSVERAYATTDTLPAPGQYAYLIVAEGDPSPAVVQQRSLTYRPVPVHPTNGKLTLPLGRFRPGAVLRVVVTDALTGRIVQRLELERPPAPAGLTLPVAGLARQGLTRIRVSITAVERGGNTVTEQVEAVL